MSTSSNAARRGRTSYRLPVSRRERLAELVSRWDIEKLETRRLLAAIAATTPLNGAQNVAVANNITVTFASAMDGTTLTTERVSVRNNAGTLVVVGLSYNTSTRVLTIDPASNLTADSGYYTVRIAGGSTGVKASDGTGLANDFQFSFTCGTPNFSAQAIFSGLNQPTNIEFAPDGRIFITEKRGIIKEFDSLTDTSATIVADLRTQVYNYWDRGLLGLALDPGFTTGRPYVYVMYAYDGTFTQAAPLHGAAGSDDDPGASDGTSFGTGRISRFTIGANNIMTGSEQVLVWDYPLQFPSHATGDLKFGPDGYLYATSGDGASFAAVDYGQTANPFGDPVNEGGALRSLDVLSDGDPTGLDGTLIRIDPNTGNAAPGNPFSSSSDANKRRIIAFGMRNSFRFNFRPGTNEIWLSEVGWNDWEEINRVANATDGVAENFGWPAWEGNAHQSGYDARNLPLIENLYAAGGDTKPYYTWAHSQQVVSGSGEPTGGSSATGNVFYTGGNYPAAYTDALFFADYSRARTYVMYRGVDGNPDPNTRQVFSAPGWGSVELTTGPNGDLFSVDLVNGRIFRYVATGYNKAPTAVITSNVTTGSVPLTINFSGASSSDPDAGDVLSYSWDLNGDGTFGDSTAAAPSYTYTTAGARTVQLRVTDRGGATSVASLQVLPGATAPVPVITTPIVGFTWQTGQTISLSGSATDAEDGTIPAANLKWDITLVHANDIDPTNYHLHDITGFTGASGTFVAPDHEWPNWLQISLTATDSTGLKTTVTRRIDPKTITLSFNSNPPGLQVAVNSGSYTTPFSRTAVIGSTNSISATTPQNVGNNTYIFNSWSQGGAASQTLIAPATSSSYTAVFDVSTNVKLTGTAIGTAGTTNNTRDKAFDGSLSTYFDATTADGGWAGLDLGSTARSRACATGPVSTTRRA
ncbi:MAG: PQQ-dependent sugar dehydrogenase [Tepidisphaeraceae bacterium]